MRLFSRISASASERVAVNSTRTICATIMAMRGLASWPRKYEDKRFLRFLALPTYSTWSPSPIIR